MKIGLLQQERVGRMVPFLPLESIARNSWKDRLQIVTGAVHVWALKLDDVPESREWCRHFLSPEERERANRFASEQSRTEYVLAHGSLRHLLGRYCEMDPRVVEFHRKPWGKPVLANGPEEISFNLAHSYGRALIAVSNRRDVGIDLERVRENVETSKLTERFFSLAEQDALGRVLPDRQRETFFNYWVAKEAILKGQGVGLHCPLDECQIELFQEGSRARLAATAPSRLQQDWTIWILRCDAGWAGAVAAQGEDWKVLYGGTEDVSLS